MRLARVTRWSWALGLAVFWIALSTAIYLNRGWFSLFEHALSDLGGERAVKPEVFNLGLILTAAIIASYSLYLRERFGSIPAALMLATAATLAGVGVFPVDEEPHLLFSVAFFLTAYLTVASAGFKLFSEKKTREAAVIALFIALAAIGLAAPWPSIALLELFLIAVLALSMLVISLS